MGEQEPSRKRKHISGQDDAHSAPAAQAASSKRSKVDAESDLQPKSTLVAENISQPAPTAASTDDDEKSEAHRQPPGVEAVQNIPDVSDDADWMRSRTSRLLGLVEDEGDTNPRSETPNDGVASKAGNINNTPGSGQTPEEQSPSFQEDHVQHSQAPVSPQEEVQLTRRLFLRNLAYGVSQVDIEALLEPYGIVLEVSYLVIVALKTICKMNVPDRDNLCFACDVKLGKAK